MSVEWIGIILSAATLIVIGATAVAAVVQLRHLRASNQLSALLEILDQWNAPALREAYARFHSDLPAKLTDPNFRADYSNEGSMDRSAHPEMLVFDFWEQVGTYAKHGLIDERILLDIISAQVYNAWKRASPAIVLARKTNGGAVAENFEYLAVRAALWNKKYGDGTYPRSLPRMTELEPGSARVPSD
ncbi:MAG TPA: hypothetical protein VFO25_13885 [Candidatus Eremiobacteraceae bacterium]|nr:hypothetical protein [Candidatus Eremiobacteraceae bacterium]